MRLRRETGDFSIVFGDNTECQIRKGLAAEDLVGAVIQNRTLIGVVTGTLEDTGSITLKCADAAASANDSFVYNPVTGIVKYTNRNSEILH